MCATPPRCLGQFLCTPAERPEPWNADDIAVWKIACPCGSQHGSFLGYPLKRFDPNSPGADFVSPLGFECVKCRQTTEIFDTKCHGYHAEACASSSAVRGEGDRNAFACPACAAKTFEVLTSFFFWPASVDLVEDEPEEFESRAQDLFCEFVAHGRCQDCGKITRFTDFGKL